jgi:isoquinoline 1-oxidoreductase alpha subunit
MQALTLLEQNDQITELDINTIMGGNICRCGSYVMLKKSIIETAKQMGKWHE